MAITRFDRFTDRDYSMEHFVPKEVMPNFEAWGEILMNQQKSYDNYNVALSQKNPMYLQTEEDRKLFQEYKSMADNAITSVSDAYLNNGLSSGNRLMKQQSLAIANEWKPGGKAFLLEDRLNSYKAAREEIEKTFKDDTNPANKWYAYKQLEDQLAKPVNYDPETGAYNRISTPELYKDANILKSVTDAIDKIKESGNTDIVRMSPFWLKKIQTEGRSAETMAAVTNALLQQPEFSRQRDIEALYKVNSIDPNQAKEQFSLEQDKQYKSLESNIANLKTKEQIKDLQEQLIEQGYDLKADGEKGAKTINAINDYLAKQKTAIENKKANFNINEYGKNLVNQSYINYAKSFANKKTNIDLVYDKGREWQERKTMEMQRTQAFVSEMQKMREVTGGKVLATPGDAKVMDQYHKLKEKSTKDAEQSKAQLNTILNTKDSSGKSLSDRIGGNPNDVSFFLNAYKTSGGNPEKFAGTINSNKQYSGKTKEELDQLFGIMTTSAPALDQSYNAYQQTNNQKELFDRTDEAVSQAYTNDPEGKKEYNRLKELYMQPGESESDFLRAINNKDSRFDGKNGFLTTPKNAKAYGVSGTVFGNEAESFLKKRNDFVKKNPEAFANSVNTYTIIGSKDSTVGEMGQLLTQDIENKNFIGYTSEGKQGLVWRKQDGNDEIDVTNLDLQNVNWEMTTLGTNGAGYMFTAKAKDPKGGVKDVVAYVDKIPETHKDVVKQALIGAKKNAKEANDGRGEEAVTQAIAVLEGYDFTKAAAQNALNVNDKNASATPVIFPAMNSQGQLIKGGSVKELNGVHLEDVEAGDNVYGKYKTKDSFGNTLYVKTLKRFDDTGALISEVVVPNKNGGYYYNNSQDIDFSIKSKFYDLNIPVESNMQKVPTGQIIESFNLLNSSIDGEN
jgi:hypothetical protein